MVWFGSCVCLENGMQLVENERGDQVWDAFSKKRSERIEKVSERGVRLAMRNGGDFADIGELVHSKTTGNILF